MDNYFKGKKALVTGASRGIGRAVTIQLATLGTQVIAIGRSQTHLDSLKLENALIQTVNLDIRDWDKTKEVLRDIGAIDFLVNSAGEGFIKPLEDLAEEDVDRIFDLNVKSLINITQIVVQNLIKTNARGSIVNLSSQASLVGLLQHTVYCASKGAVDAFTRACALELGPRNVRVNCVNPTVVMTEMGRKWWSDPERGEPMLAKIPLGRFCEVQEVVDAVVFLLSEKSSMITGTCLALDGGFTTT